MRLEVYLMMPFTPPLEHMGFSESLISLIRDIYTDSTMVIRTKKDEETDPIPVHAGVKQGCPVSPILFNHHRIINKDS
jgi:hypothetical protein